MVIEVAKLIELLLHTCLRMIQYLFNFIEFPSLLIRLEQVHDLRVEPLVRLGDTFVFWVLGDLFETNESRWCDSFFYHFNND